MSVISLNGNRKPQRTTSSKRGYFPLAKVQGKFADAVAYAIFWRFSATKGSATVQQKGQLLSAKGKTPQVEIRDCKVVFLIESWGHFPPTWLIEKASEYLDSVGNRTKKKKRRPHIKRVIRQSFWRGQRQALKRRQRMMRRQQVSA